MLNMVIVRANISEKIISVSNFFSFKIFLGIWTINKYAFLYCYNQV